MTSVEKIRLHEYDADAILDWLEQRQDQYADAKHEADVAEQHVKVMFARSYLAIREAKKCSVEDARMRVTADPAYIDAWKESLRLGMKKDKAQLALERMRTGVDLWRSEQANRRKV